MRMIGRESSQRDGAVYMRMMQQVLSPGMQDAEETDLGAQMLGICGHLQKRGRDGTKEQIVKDALVPQNQRVQFARNREYHVEVTGCQKFTLPGGLPTLARLSLTLRTVAITA